MQVTATSFPPPNSVAEVELMFDVARNIPYFSEMTVPEQDDLIRRLQAYECYVQAVTLLQWRLQSGTRGEIQKLDDYVSILRIWHDGCEDLGKFIETAKDCISKLRLSFTTVRVRLVENILGHDNYTAQAKVYRALASSFEDVGQRVLLMERLAFLYEKKLTLNLEVESTYQEILELDPNNLKALRYLKVIAVQSGHWREAARTLEQMVASYSSSFERERAAFELAQIYLYQLNQAKKAKEILTTHCANTRIDTSQTYCEALERLNDHDELLTYLSERSLELKDDASRSRVKHKMGIASLKAGKASEAIEHLKSSIELQPTNLMAHETLVSALIDSKRGKELVEELKTLSKNVSQDASLQTINALIQRANSLLA